MTGVRIPLEQGSPEWLAARRDLITATDIGVWLDNPRKSEATLAREKLGEIEPQASTLPMRVGLALEPLIQAEYEAMTGRRLRRFHGLIVHREIPWAAASPDWWVVGERRLMEGKWRSSSFDALPQDIEGQVVWQLGVTGYEAADVAVLVGGRELRVFTVEADPATFDGLVTIAEDFRRRLEAGGPFAENAASVKARYPADDGTEMVADDALRAAVLELGRTRGERRMLEEYEETLETAIKAKMADHAVLVGDGFRVTWKRTKDREEVDWKNIATGLLNTLSETDRETVMSLSTVVKPGFRPFKVTLDKHDAS